MLGTARQVIGKEVTTHPVASAGAALTAGAANTYGAYVELAAAGVVANNMRLASLCVRTPSGACTGKIQIAEDTGGTPATLAEIDVEIATDAGGYMQMNLVGMGGLITAGNNVGARFKTTAGATTCTASVGLMDD